MKRWLAHAALRWPCVLSPGRLGRGKVAERKPKDGQGPVSSFDRMREYMRWRGYERNGILQQVGEFDDECFR
jgi:hypothetical protein